MIKLVVLSLLFGVFTVPTTAVANDTVSKTFTVRGANDALLAGAQVRFSWRDSITDAQIIGTAATTNASGVATLTAPLNARFLSYGVFPAVGDRVNALQPETSISSAASGTVNVKLQVANFLVNVQKSDGSDVTGGAVLNYPNESNHTWPISGTSGASAYVIRSGVVGIRLATDLNPASNYALAILQNIDNFQPGQFSWRFGLKASGSSGNQSYTVYSDTSFMGSTLTPANEKGSYLQ